MQKKLVLHNLLHSENNHFFQKLSIKWVSQGFLTKTLL
jgi:hypothetical protein